MSPSSSRPMLYRPALARDASACIELCMDGFAKAPDPPAPSTLSLGWQLARTGHGDSRDHCRRAISTAEMISDIRAQGMSAFVCLTNDGSSGSLASRRPTCLCRAARSGPGHVHAGAQGVAAGAACRRNHRRDDKPKYPGFHALRISMPRGASTAASTAGSNCRSRSFRRAWATPLSR